VVCLHNVSDSVVSVQLPFSGIDLLTETAVAHHINLEPYQVAWIKLS